MPLKRRRVDAEATNSEEKDDEDDSDGQEPRRSLCSKKKRSVAYVPIVISDSDGEMQEEKKEEQWKKVKKQSVCSKLEAKRRIAQMTEEEQLELAVKMSEQEASQANYQQDKEEELLKKAIAESLSRQQFSKCTGKKRTTLRRTYKEPTQQDQPENEEDLECSVATCPDSLPPSESPSPPNDKPNLQQVSEASSASPKTGLASAPRPNSCYLSPIRKPISQLQGEYSGTSPVANSVSQMLHGARIPSPVQKLTSKELERASSASSVTKCTFQQLNVASIASPAQKSNFQLLGVTNGMSPVRKPSVQPMCKANSLSPIMKPASQSPSGFSCILSPVSGPSSQPLGSASCPSSPIGKPASQHLSRDTSLSPIKKSASHPLCDAESCSPVGTCAADRPAVGVKSPVVVLERLSQDVVEKSSVVLSPACCSTFSSLSQNVGSPALTDSSDPVPLSPLKHPFSLSPTFPKRSPCAWQMAPRRLESSLAKSQGTVNKDRGDVASVFDSAGQELSGGSTPENLMDLPDDSIHGQRYNWQAQDTEGKEGHRDTVPTLPPQSLHPSASQGHSTQLQDEGMVHYYWGVPFCPKGGNPNQYTQVILCQLEVYQKSLKQAQRQLLQKREYGPPILPSPPSLRRNDRRRMGESAQWSKDYARGDRKIQEGPLSDSSRESSQSPAPEERTAQTDDGPTTSYMQSQCVEETPEGSAVNEDDIDGEPMQDSSSDSALSGEVQESQELVGTQEQEEEKEKEKEEEEEEEEEDLTVCPETQPSLTSDTDAERRDIPMDESRSLFQSGPVVLVEEPESMEPIMAEVEPTMSDLEPAVTDVEPSLAEVQCPLCGQGFAVEEIERHAADCDGHTEPVVGRQKVSVLTRRQRGVKSTPMDMGDLLSSIGTGKRKTLFESPLSPQFPNLGKYEKCYVCRELVPLRQYQGHVDNCLRTADLETQGSRRLRNTKEVGRSEGRLLSLLDQSESMSADAETRTSVQRRGAERLHPYKGDEEEEADDVHSSKEPSSPDDFTSQLNLSNSPIKSFVSISEATDCLVDFKQQFSKAPGRGRSRGPSRGTSKRSRNRGWRGKRR